MVKATKPPETDDPDDLPEHEEELETPDDVLMTALVDEMQEMPDATIRIYRVGKNTREITLIDEVPPANYTPIMLKDPPYNGGKFRVYGHYKGRIVFNKIIQVEASPPKPEPKEAASQDLTPILSMIQEQGKQFRDALMVLAGSQKPQESRIEFFKELAVMKELFASPPQPRETNKDPIEMLKTVMELQNLMGQKEVENSSPLLAMGMKMFDKLSEMQKVQQNVQLDEYAPNPSPVAVPARLSPPGQLGPHAPVKTQEEDMSPQMMLNFIIKAAETNGNKEYWADKLYDNLDDESFDTITNDPEWFNKFSALDPRIAINKDWFEGVRELVLIRLNNEEQDLTPEPKQGKSAEKDADPANDPKPPS